MSVPPTITRLESGAIVEDVEVPSYGVIGVRFSRCDAGWQAAFELRHTYPDDPDVEDLAVVHRLVAPTRAEARASVPLAVAFLLGHSLDGFTELASVTASGKEVAPPR